MIFRALFTLSLSVTIATMAKASSMECLPENALEEVESFVIKASEPSQDEATKIRIFTGEAKLSGERSESESKPNNPYSLKVSIQTTGKKSYLRIVSIWHGMGEGDNYSRTLSDQKVEIVIQKDNQFKSIQDAPVKASGKLSAKGDSIEDLQMTFAQDERALSLKASQLDAPREPVRANEASPDQSNIEFALKPLSVSGLGTNPQIAEFYNHYDLPDMIPNLDFDFLSRSNRIIVGDEVNPETIAQVTFNDEIHPSSLNDSIKLFRVSPHRSIYEDQSAKIKAGFLKRSDGSFSLNRVAVVGTDANGVPAGEYILVIDRPRRLNPDGSMGTWPESQAAVRFVVSEKAFQNTGSPKLQVSTVEEARVLANSMGTKALQIPMNAAEGSDDVIMRLQDEQNFTNLVSNFLDLGGISPQALIGAEFDKEVDPASLNQITVMTAKGGKPDEALEGLKVRTGLKGINRYAIEVEAPEGGYAPGDYYLVIPPSVKFKHPELGAMQNKYLAGNQATLIPFKIKK